MGLYIVTFKFGGEPPCFETLRHAIGDEWEAVPEMHLREDGQSVVYSLGGPRRDVAVSKRGQSLTVECMAFANIGPVYQALEKLGGVHPDWTKAEESNDFGEWFLWVCADGSDFQFRMGDAQFTIWSPFLVDAQREIPDVRVIGPINAVLTLAESSMRPHKISSEVVSSFAAALDLAAEFPEEQFLYGELPRVLRHLARFPGSADEDVYVEEL